MKQITALDIVHEIGDMFNLDTNEIAQEFFANDSDKALKFLKSTGGLHQNDDNWIQVRGQKQCYVWQIAQGDSQGWSRDEARSYCLDNAVDPDRVVSEV